MEGRSSAEPIGWTTRRLLEWTTGFFERRGLEHARLRSELLLAHVLGRSRLELYMDPHRPANDLEKAAFHDLVERAAGHEPVDYLVGHCSFYSLTFKVNPSVLIPRPSTETLVEHVIEHARRTPGLHHPVIADVGTGSGVIAITLAKHIPGSRVIATDLSQDALHVAKQNAQALSVGDQIEFRIGDLLEPLKGVTVDYLVSNPPYISDTEWEVVPTNVKDYEPHLALRSGADGLDHLRPLIEQAPAYLNRPGQLVVEIAASQKQAVLGILDPNLSNPHVLADHEGLPRVLVADTR